ncbi:hypothetical protein BD769DRAFT_1391249 [Suillus cothurnatus]|nr:hypothetical protein BD769DRAFT_1391249 [Suillus cothurnatus]
MSYGTPILYNIHHSPRGLNHATLQAPPFALRSAADVRLGSFTNQRQVTELQALLTDLATTARPIMYSVSLYARADSSPHYLELTIIKVQPSPNKPCFPSHPQLNHYDQILHNSKIMNECSPLVLPRSRTKSINNIVCTWLNSRATVPANADKERKCMPHQKSSESQIWIQDFYFQLSPKLELEQSPAPPHGSTPRTFSSYPWSAIHHTPVNTHNLVSGYEEPKKSVSQGLRMYSTYHPKSGVL